MVDRKLAIDIIGECNITNIHILQNRCEDVVRVCVSGQQSGPPYHGVIGTYCLPHCRSPTPFFIMTEWHAHRQVTTLVTIFFCWFSVYFVDHVEVGAIAYYLNWASTTWHTMRRLAYPSVMHSNDPPSALIIHQWLFHLNHLTFPSIGLFSHSPTITSVSSHHHFSHDPLSLLFSLISLSSWPTSIPIALSHIPTHLTLQFIYIE